MVGPVNNPIIPNLDSLQLPTDTFKTHTFSNIGSKIQEKFSGGVLNNIQKLGQAYMKFKDSPPKKTTKSEACFWIAVLCAIVAVALFVGLSVAMGPGGIVLALNLALIPGFASALLVGKGLRERKKEQKLKEWEIPKLKYQPNPKLSEDVNKEKEKEFRSEGENLWGARNTAKWNMEENQRKITELKIELMRKKAANLPTDAIQAKIDQRNQDKVELFKDFEDKSVKFWSLARPERGAALKERFNEARKNRGEQELFQIEDLMRGEEI